MRVGFSSHSSNTSQRSRKGCTACRKRRKKCDELRPICTACHDRDLECIYALPTTRSTYNRPNSLATLMPYSRKTYFVNTNFHDRLTHQPSTGSETFLINHFRTKVAELICFSCADECNPFYAHILPLIYSSLLVHTAVQAVAAAHLHVLGISTSRNAEVLQSQTLKLLADDLAGTDSDKFKEDTLAGSLLLIYYEIVLGNCARTARCHLQGAKSLLDVRPKEENTSCFRFLCNVFHYFDVMVSLSLHEAPLGSISYPLEDCTGVDGTFGLVGSLWPMMEKLAMIITLKDSGADIIDQAKMLELQLHSWSARQVDETANENDVNLEAMLQIAKAYQCCSLLTLYSCIVSLEASGISYDYHNHSTREIMNEQIYQQAFDSLLRVCVLSGPMSTLTWPLHTIGMLAKSTGDQRVVRRIFATLNERQNMKVVEAASNSVMKHWDQACSKTHGIKPMAILLG